MTTGISQASNQSEATTGLLPPPPQTPLIHMLPTFCQNHRLPTYYGQNGYYDQWRDPGQGQEPRALSDILQYALLVLDEDDFALDEEAIVLEPATATHSRVGSGPSEHVR